MRRSTLVAATGIALAVGLYSASDAWSFSLRYKGFNYVSYYNGGYQNADSMSAMIGAGANAAALAFEYGIDVQNSAVYADVSYTDPLSVIAATILEARGRGLSVMVRPLIDFLDPSKIGTYQVADWRSYYNPTDPAAFFASYKTMIVSVAQVAQANGADILCIGVELDQLTGPSYLVYWTDIISSVRAVFSGTLTYSADWDSSLSPWQGQHGLGAGTGDITTQVSFWSQLDFMGIDCYAAISDAASPTLANLIAGWNQVPSDATTHAVTGNQSLISYFESVATQTGKPLLFTEIGYESATDAAIQPAGSSTNVYDPTLQANLYTAFFTAWQQSGDHSLVGAYFWNWDPNAAEVGPGNVNFSPQGLPAQTVVVANYGVTLTASPSSGVAPLAVTFTVDFGQGVNTNIYTVDFGDGSTGTLQAYPLGIACTVAGPCNQLGYKTTHTYGAAGAYTARLLNANTQIASAGVNITATSGSIGRGDWRRASHSARQP
jgi:serralysin